MGAITVLNQMTMIAVLAAIGFFLQKKKVLDKNSTPVISRIVVDICNPALIVSTILTGNITVTQSGSCNAMTINSSSGNVKAEADKVSKMDVKASSGNITITGNEITDLNSKSSSGHNTFDFAKAPKTSEIKSSSGWVKIYMPGDSDVTVRAKISSGDFNSELPFSKSGKEYTSGNGSSTMNINVSSGDVDIYKK